MRPPTTPSAGFPARRLKDSPLWRTMSAERSEPHSMPARAATILSICSWRRRMGRTNERLGERGEGTGLREGKARGGAPALCEERAAALDGAVELVEEGVVEHTEDGALARDEPD